jgi:hypothetical protein
LTKRKYRYWPQEVKVQISFWEKDMALIRERFWPIQGLPTHYFTIIPASHKFPSASLRPGRCFEKK